MSTIFTNTYDLFNRKRWIFVLILFSIIGFIAYSVFNLQLEENINAIIPQDQRIDNFNSVFKNSKFADQIILNFSFKETTADKSPDQLKKSAETLIDSLTKDTALIKSVRFKIEDDAFKEVYDFFYNNLPLYLSDQDYSHLDSLFSSDSLIAKTLLKDFKSLISPAGIATKKYIFRDPFSITPLALKKLQNFRLDNNFIVYKSCIYTKDKKHLLAFVEPRFPASNISKNEILINTIDNAVTTLNADSLSSVRAEYYGGTAVAVANAKRIKWDIMLTVNIAFAFIFLLFLLFFRKIKILFLLFIPVILGAGLAISLIAIIDGNISAIALGIGAILVGISVDYSLHIFTHFRNNGSIKQTLKDVALPIIISSGTTASAFLCLFVIHSKALNQLGMFGAFSVFFAALIVLFIIPYLLTRKGFQIPKTTKLSFLDKISAYNIDKNKFVLASILILSVVFSFTVSNIRFNGDIAGMNYLPENLARAEKNLQHIISETLSAVYVITTGKTLETALQKTEKAQPVFEKSKHEKLFSAMSSASCLLLSKAQQQAKIEQWNRFLDKINRQTLARRIQAAAPQFKPTAFQQFYDLINRKFSPIPLSRFDILKTNFLDNYIHQSNGQYAVVSILKVTHKNKPKLFRELNADKDIIIFDKQFFANQFFEILKEDFNKLMWFSMALVFIIILLSFGRIELALITFSPILLSWLWTLGLMGLFDIQFNIFNIIISTFVFGLGVDYSIFIMRGLLDNYKYGNRPLTPYKLSVLLSFLTTILGIGVLIFAKHPALKSIAVVSIFGMTSVILISYTILPWLFSFLTRYNGKPRRRPVTFIDFFFSVFSLLLFVVESILLTISIPLFHILPLPVKTKKYIFHSIISGASKFIVWINFTIKKETIDAQKLDFSNPVILAPNHQSHLDLVLMLRLNPKIIAITNKWVYHNAIYGFIVRYANYYPIYDGLDTNFDKLKKKVSEGYSILIFPEGSRSADGSIKRYHQGVFKLADDLGLDIQPVLIHGAYQCLPKTEFFMHAGKITIKYLDKIKVKPIKPEENETYRPQAKALTMQIRNEFATLTKEIETPDFFRQQLISQFIYKGPVVEWYTRIKTKLEKNYQFFDNIIPQETTIVDIGCGYGYLDIMLHYVSDKRTIIGIDYDKEKIETANQIVRHNDNINFFAKDITEEDFPPAEVYILNDVLHYMPKELQINVLNKCLDKVSEGGMIIIRDADADLEKRTKVTKATEIQSTKIFKFNKTKYDLSFISGTIIENTANAKGFSCQRIDNAKHTSNITYIIRKNG